jgi:hypothetical protein
MASTLPLTGNGDITMNSTPANGKIKLTNASSGAGKILTIEGSNASGSGTNGGNIVLTPGTGVGSGVNGNVGIGTATPGEKLEVSGNIKLPTTNRVWTTQKVFNVLDYGATPLVMRSGALGTTASITSGTPGSITQTGCFANVSVGDTLWVFNGSNFGSYQITAKISSDTVQVANFASTQTNVRFNVTAGTL